MRKDAAKVTTIEAQLENYERAIACWEVSCYDLAQTDLYLDWIKKTSASSDVDSITNAAIQDPSKMYAAFERPPKEVLDNALISLGMDINQGYERQLCMHKTFGGYSVYGERYVGFQRTDKEWKDFIKKVTQ